MALLSLPLFNDVTHYDYSIELEGVTYQFEFRWNARDASWYLSVMTADGEPLLLGRRMVIGSDLLVRLRDARRPPGQLFLLDTSGEDREAGQYDLGVRAQLYYLET